MNRLLISYFNHFSGIWRSIAKRPQRHKGTKASSFPLSVFVSLWQKNALAPSLPYTLIPFLFNLSPVFAQDSEALNVELVGQATYGVDLADIWGYADKEGTEYALVGTTDGVSIVSLENPAEPKELFFLNGAISNWRDIKTYKEYAYVSNESGRGIQIIYLSQLPNDITTKDTVIAGVRTAHNLWVDENGLLYIIGLETSIEGMIICDLKEDPWNPQLTGFYDDAYVHDAYVRNNLAYLAEIDDFRLSIVDLSNPTNAQVLGTQSYRNSFTHNTWLNDSGNVCFTTDETRDVYIRSWDITDPTNIRPLDSIRSQLSGVTSGAAVPHNVHVLNDYLITSHYTDGIHITDASEPEELIEVGYYDTSPFSGTFLEGCWGAYPFLPSGLILASDIQEGLFVLRPQYQRASFVKGVVTDLLTGDSIENVYINIIGEDKETFSKPEGDYIIGLNDEGTVELEIIKFGYFPDTITVNLERGVSQIVNIELMPTTTQPFHIQLIDQDTREPIQNGQVLLASFQSDLEAFFQTDASGNATQEELTLGYYDITVGKWGYIPQQERFLLLEGDDSLVIALERGYADNFTLDFEWAVTGTAKAGIWERAIPRETKFDNTPINPPRDVDEDFGKYAYVTGNQGTTFSDDDVDDGFTRLSSPIFDLSNYQSPNISFRWWQINYIAFSQGGQPGNGYLDVEISNGTETVQIARYDRAFNSDLWQETSILVSDFLTPTSEMQIHFTSADPDPGNIVEGGIDDFLVFEQTPTFIQDKDALISFNAYPNPILDRLNITYQLESASPIEFRLLNLQGAIIATHYQKSTSQTNFQLPFHYPAGIYFLQIRKDNRLIGVKKLVKY